MTLVDGVVLIRVKVFKICLCLFIVKTSIHFAQFEALCFFGTILFHICTEISAVASF